METLKNERTVSNSNTVDNLSGNICICYPTNRTKGLCTPPSNRVPKRAIMDIVLLIIYILAATWIIKVTSGDFDE